MHCGLERGITISSGDIHVWIYDDVTDNCVLNLQRKTSFFVTLLHLYYCGTSCHLCNETMCYL